MGVLIDAYNTQYGNSMASPVKASEGSSSSAAGGATVTAGVLSGLTSIITGFINAGRIKNTAKFNAGMADIEARMAQTQADFTSRINRVSAKYAIAQIRRTSDQLFSKQRALYAKAGVTFSGSPAEVMTESLKQAELDVFATDLNADIASWNGQFAATNIATEKKAEADIYRMGAQSVYVDAGTSASNTILSMLTKHGARG